MGVSLGSVGWWTPQQKVPWLLGAWIGKPKAEPGAKVFRDGGDQAEVARDPCEGAEEDPPQCPTAAGEQLRPAR